jgi:quercetin dioxygenase-like cupin family protein
MTTTGDDMTTTATAVKRSFATPDEGPDLPKAKAEMITIGEHHFGRVSVEPGWRWSEHVKPIAKTDSCEFPHACYVISGAFHVAMDDGTELDLVADDVFVISPGHDAWVVGDEPCVLYDLGTADDTDFGKPPQ